MARHTVHLVLKNKGSNVIDEFTATFLSYMNMSNEIIDTLGSKTHKDWLIEIGETKRIPYSKNIDKVKYVDTIFNSEEYKKDGWSYIRIGEVTLTDKEKDNDLLFDQWIQNRLDNIQTYFNADLRLKKNFSGIDFDISEEKNCQVFFWAVRRLFEVFPENIHSMNVKQTSGNTELHCIFPDRRAISWMQLIKAELLAEDVPSAYAIWYMPNIGSVVVSTQQVFDNDIKQHRDTAHAIEQELHKIGLLPLIKDSSDLGFIGRKEWRKNMGLTN